MVKIARVGQCLSITTEEQGVLSRRMFIRHISKCVQLLWLKCQFLPVTQFPMPAVILPRQPSDGIWLLKQTSLQGHYVYTNQFLTPGLFGDSVNSQISLLVYQAVWQFGLGFLVSWVNVSEVSWAWLSLKGCDTLVLSESLSWAPSWHSTTRSFVSHWPLSLASLQHI